MRCPRFLSRMWSPEAAVTGVSFLIADLIDKPLWVLGLISDGRFIGHTLLITLLVAGAFALVKRDYGWYALSGGIVHRLLDLGGFMPWLYPFKSYIWPVIDYHRIVTWWNIAETFVEMAVIILLVFGAVAIGLKVKSRLRGRRTNG